MRHCNFNRLLFFIGLECFCFCFYSSAQAQVVTDEVNPNFTKVASNDCGVDGAQDFLVEGSNYTMPNSLKGSKEGMTCNFGNKVIYAFNGIDIKADYQLELKYLSDGVRQQHIIVDGNEIHSIKLEAGKEQHVIIDLPRKAYAYGQLVLMFELNGTGPNAIVSELNLYSSNAKATPTPFDSKAKQALKKKQQYEIDTDVDVEEVLPTYAVIPSQTNGVYNPVKSLNGTWKFNASPSKDFYKQPLDSEWKSIVVPGQWSMQGFKVDSAAYAGYQKTFVVPDDWKDNVVKLRFYGVHSEYKVFLNGKPLGQHLGGMTAYELDITPYLKSGENHLALFVRSESLADMLGSLTQYAMHQLGGITRKVTLFALPKTHISDLRISTPLYADYKNAELQLQTAVTNTTNNVQKGLKLCVKVKGLPDVIEKDLPELVAGEVWKGTLNDSVVAPLLWNQEHPNLYKLSMELYQDDKLLESIDKTFGFRQVEVVGNQVLVNGKAIKLRGVCHHEVYPITGRSVCREIAKQDVGLFKVGNCNFLRTSHYPPSEDLLDFCDEMGMFVEVEAPICWIGHGANSNWQTLNYQDKKYYDYVLQANMEMIQLYRNHPSVIFWSMANESYWNKGFAQVQEYVDKADPTRPHTFHDQAYGGYNNQGSTAPIANIHYPGPDGYKVAAKSERPMVYGEYCHLNAYNRNELVTDPGIRDDWVYALSPTWENMYKTKGALGGSIWAGIDDIFLLPDGKACGYGGWGPIDGWRRPKPEYWNMKKIYSPVKVTTISLEPGNELAVDVENRYTFTNLNELKIYYRFGNEDGVTTVNVMPHECGKLVVPIKNPDNSKKLYLSFTDNSGHIVDEYMIPVGKQPENDIAVPQEISTKLKTRKGEFVITGSRFTCKINRITGQIVSLVKNGTQILVGGPSLMVLPLIGGASAPEHSTNIPPFNDLCKNWKATAVSAAKEGKNVVVHVEGCYQNFEGNYDLTVNSSGELQVSYKFKALENVNPRQWGMVFESPKEYNRNFWCRDGMWNIYPKDHIGRNIGEAPLFYPGLAVKENPCFKPNHSWNMDFNDLGSNDFRSTKRNIWYAGLKNSNGDSIVVKSNGHQHWRSWLKNGKIQFLVADFASPGCEMFAESHYSIYRKPIQKGQTVSGKVQLVL